MTNNINDVKVIKLCTGEEVIAKIIKETPETITLKSPLMISQVPGAQPGQIGVGLIPWIMTSINEEVEIATENIITTLPVKKEVEKMFLEQTTGLTLI